MIGKDEVKWHRVGKSEEERGKKRKCGEEREERGRKER